MENNNSEKNSFQKNKKSKQIDITVGCTIGSNFKATQIIELKRLGIKHFQIVAEFSYNCKYIPPNEMLAAILDDCTVIIHMPFYFHYMLTLTNSAKLRIRNLQRYWEKRQEKTHIISHCKGWRNRYKSDVLNYLTRNIKMLASEFSNLEFLLENDAGGKDNKAPTLKDISLVKKNVNAANLRCGVCLDTEHAYAAGDSLFTINYYDNVSMVHLNAIPKYVEFGKHLDRHSSTELIKSKNGTAFITKILGLIKPGTPIILERTNFDIIKKDLQLLRNFEYENIPDMDKKNVGKTLRKKANILF